MKILSIPIYSSVNYEEHERCLEMDVNQFSADILDKCKSKICEITVLYNENSKLNVNEIIETYNTIESEVLSTIDSYKLLLKNSNEEIMKIKNEKENIVKHIASKYIYILLIFVI